MQKVSSALFAREFFFTRLRNLTSKKKERDQVLMPEGIEKLICRSVSLSRL